MKKLLICYNSFGNSRPGVTSYYLDAIGSILNQDFCRENPDDVHVVLSAVIPSIETQVALRQCFSGRVSYNWITQVLPLGVTFNATVQKCVEAFGEFEGYLYVDSGINFYGQPGVIGAMYSKLNSGKGGQNGRYAMVAIRPSNDTGYELWGLPQGENVAGVVIPPSRTVNLHCQVFSNEFFKAYGNKILPDVFANDASESVFSYMCAAVNQQFYVDYSQSVLHLHSLDGASAGSRAGFLFLKPGSTKDHFTPIYEKGKEFGFGFEAIEGKWPHDQSQFDENHFAKNPGLLPFIRDNLFVPKEVFDYSSIESHFEPRP